MITQELVKELFKYKDGNLIRKVRSGNGKVGDLSGSVNADGYFQVQINGDTLLQHRLIFLYLYGYAPDLIDHIDGNKLNNQAGNLRECNKSENNYNSKIRKDNTSGIKGVSWDFSRKKWAAQIQVNRKKKMLGGFTDKQEAEKTVVAARLLFHGEFSNNG